MRQLRLPLLLSAISIFVFFVFLIPRGTVIDVLRLPLTPQDEAPEAPKASHKAINLDDAIRPPKTPQTAEPHDVRVAILESLGTRDEVASALIHAFGSQPNVEVEPFLMRQQYGMRDIVDDFDLPRPLLPYRNPFTIISDDDETYPDIVVSVSCEIDSTRVRHKFEQIFNSTKAHLLCVVHEADKWSATESQEVITPFIEHGRVDFVTLSSHTASYFRRHGMAAWPGSNAKVHVFPPVFPVEGLRTSASLIGHLSFAMQGDYEPGRRDYGRLFDRLLHYLDKHKSQNSHKVSLDLLGHGAKPPVPKDLAPHVHFDEDLPYSDYYRIMSQSFALLPALSGPEYLDRRTSSSVPAALIAGVPLVATEQILAAYSYLPLDAVWMQGQFEGDFDVVERVLTMGKRARTLKNEAVRKARDDLIQKNKQVVGLWLEDLIASPDDDQNYKLAAS